MTEMVETLVNGRWSIKLPDYRAEREEWATGWERERLDSMHANLGPGDVVYDVGTEEGDLSGLYAQWGCDLVLVEPNALVWPNVRAIWEANDLRPPLACWEGFASNESSRPPRLSALTRGWPASCTGPMIRAHGFEAMSQASRTLPTITLNELSIYTETRATAITIDVEGAELRVLEGASGILASHRPLVWVSVHDEMIRDEYGASSEAVHEFMARLGYRMHLLAIDHEAHWFYWPQERAGEVTLP